LPPTKVGAPYQDTYGGRHSRTILADRDIIAFTTPARRRRIALRRGVGGQHGMVDELVDQLLHLEFTEHLVGDVQAQRPVSLTPERVRPPAKTRDRVRDAAKT